MNAHPPSDYYTSRTPRSKSSASWLSPRPYSSSTSTTRSGGASLFFTTLMRSMDPVTSSALFTCGRVKPVWAEHGGLESR